MIFSENRYTLFRIMLDTVEEEHAPDPAAA
jgi:hypothetical protein